MRLKKFSTKSICQLLLAIGLFMIPIVVRGYKLPISNNVFYALLNLLVIIVLLQKKNVKYNKQLSAKWFVLLFWMILVNMIVLLFQPYSKGWADSSFHNYVMFIDAFVLLFLAVVGALNCDMFVKVYKYCVYVAIIFLFIQFFGYILFGVKISGRFSVLEYQTSTMFDRSLLVNTSFVRCSSYFLEPSHYAQFVVPYLCLTLYGYKDIVKKSVIASGVVSLSLVASVSGSAIVLLAIVWGLYFFQQLADIKKKHAFSLLVLFVVFIIMAFVAFNLPGTRSMILDMADPSNIKTSVRVTRGFTIFGKLPLFEKVFGIGFQNVSSVGEYYGISEATSIRNGNNEYINDICMFLLSFGIFGFIQVISIIRSIFVNSNKQKVMVGVILTAIFFSDVTLGPLWLFFMCIGVAVVDNNDN